MNVDLRSYSLGQIKQAVSSVLNDIRPMATKVVHNDWIQETENLIVNTYGLNMLIQDHTKQEKVIYIYKYDHIGRVLKYTRFSEKDYPNNTIFIQWYEGKLNGMSEAKIAKLVDAII